MIEKDLKRDRFLYAVFSGRFNEARQACQYLDVSKALLALHLT